MTHQQNNQVMTVHDRDGAPIHVGREIDVCGTAAAGSPDVVLRLGNPTGRGAETYLTPDQARQVAWALLNAAQTPTDQAEPVDDLDTADPLNSMVDLHRALDEAAHIDPSAADWRLYAHDSDGFTHHVVGVSLASGETGEWIALELRETDHPDDQ